MTDRSAAAADALAVLTFETDERLQSYAAAAGLSVQQMRLLGILRDREPTINDLGAHLNLDKSSASGLVTRAERRGLVSRTRDEHDGRAVRVRLEDAGRELIDGIDARAAEEMREFFAVLSDDQQAQWVALTTQLLTADARRRGSSISVDPRHGS